jgi:hypothetical protein
MKQREGVRELQEAGEDFVMRNWIIIILPQILSA